MTEISPSIEGLNEFELLPTPILTPSEIGARAEFEVALALVRTGRFVYAPFFAPHSRVDLILEDERGLSRVQIKTSVLKNDVVAFRTK